MLESMYDKKILLVDDDQGILAMLKTLLAKGRIGSDLQ